MRRINQTGVLSNKEQKAWKEFEATCTRIRTATKTIAYETAKQKEKRIKGYFNGTVKGFIDFSKYYFPDYVKAEFGWFHKEAIKGLVNHESFIVLEFPREHAKSVLLDVFTPMYYIGSEWLEGLILASENADKAKVLIRDVEAQLRSNQRFINDFGDPGIMGSWQQGHFSTIKGVGFWAFGLGQNPAGTREGARRPNFGIVDDADSKAKAKNQQRVKDDVDWCLGEFMNCLQLGNSVFAYANNRIARDGLTAHIVGDIEPEDPKREGIYHIKVYATEDPRTHEKLMIDEGGVPAWPENFTLEKLKRRFASIGYRITLRQFYHEHIEDGNLFLPEHTTWTKPLPLHIYDSLVAYCDPSFSSIGDFKAIVLLGLIGKYIDALWCWVRQTSPTAMVQAYYNLKARIDAQVPTQIYQDTHAGFQEVNCRYFIEGTFAQK